MATYSKVASQQWKRASTAGAPLPEVLFVLSVLTAIRRRLIGARDLIIDSAPILAWRQTNPDAAVGHAPTQHPRPLLRGYCVQTNASLVASFCSFTRPCPPLCGWSDIERQIALTYAASIIVGLTAQHAGRPDLICSPKCVLAHTCEGFES